VHVFSLVITGLAVMQFSSCANQLKYNLVCAAEIDSLQVKSRQIQFNAALKLLPYGYNDDLLNIVDNTKFCSFT